MAKLGFGFIGDSPTQKIRYRAQYMRCREAQVSMQSDFQNSNFDENPNFLPKGEEREFHFVKVVLFRLALVPC